MEEFLNKLYSYEYFGMYLMIAIAVLVLLFIIVLFFGKKDQKKREIEETRKLQQINNTDAFKEESNVESVEAPKEDVKEPVVTQEQLENDTIIVPNINDLTADAKDEFNNIEMPEPILPKDTAKDEITSTEQVEIDSDLNVENVEQDNNPILDKIEEKPLIFNEPEEENMDFTMPDEIDVQTTPLVDVPDFNLDEIVSGVEEIKEEEKKAKPTEIFSSVYVPEKENIELPKVEETKHIKEELDIELPTLKKEVEKEKIEIPEIKDYNLDNITGENYNIK